MFDIQQTDRRVEKLAPGSAREESVADAVAALQLILLALVAALEERGVIDPQMLAHRLRGTFPVDAEDSIAKGLIEVFGRRLEAPEKPAETKSPPNTAVNGWSSHTLAVEPPSPKFQAYSLIDRG